MESVEAAIIKGAVKGLVTKAGSQSSFAPSTRSFNQQIAQTFKLPRIFKSTKDDLSERDEEEIELESPLTPTVPQQLGRYVLCVYQAEGVPCGQLAKLPGKAKEEPVFVQASFGQHSAKTKTQDSDLRMAWNEQFTFVEAFPPPHNSLWIQIYSGESSAFSSPKIIGTHILDLAKISDDADRGFLPTFGPAYVNLYGSKSGSGTLKRGEEAGFIDSFELAAYKGRVFISLEVELLREFVLLPIGVQVSPCKSMSTLMQAHTMDFLLFGCIFDVSMLSKKLQNKPVQLEVNIGHAGDTGSGSVMPKLMERSALLSPTEGFFSHPFKTSSTTPALSAQIRDQKYCSVSFGDKKPCVYVHTSLDGGCSFQWRMFHSNYMHKMTTFMEERLSEISHLLDYSKERAAQNFDQMLNDLMQECREYSNHFGSNSMPTDATRLDREIWRTIQEQIDYIASEGAQFMIGGQLEDVEDKVHAVKELLNKLQKFGDNPQDNPPDIFIWLKSGQKRLAYIRAPAKEFIFSAFEKEKGSLCSKLHSFHFQIHARRSEDEAFSKIQGQLVAAFWFGLNSTRQGVLSGLPVGYQGTKEVLQIEEEHSSLPASLLFTEKQTFELRCHLCQGKCLLPLDASGFSDPFCRVMFQGQSVSSMVISQTLNPLWDETLSIPSVTLYGTVAHVKKHPPHVVLEILDQDLFGTDEEFMGQVMGQPRVQLHEDAYSPPQLRWYPVTRGSEHGGEVLVAFELIQLYQDGGSPNGVPNLVARIDENSENKPVVRIPESIRPTLSKYRLEVLFWCLRDLQRLYLQAVEKPRVDVECGKAVISSEILKNCVKNPMFTDMVEGIDLDLPDDPGLWPAITIRCMESRSFGRATVVGSAVINKLHSFVCTVASDKETYDNVGSIESEMDMMDSAMKMWGEPLKRAGTGAAVSMMKDAVKYKGEYIPLETTDNPITSLMLTLEEEEEEDQEERRRKEKLKLDWWSKYYASIPDMPGQDEGDHSLAKKIEDTGKKKDTFSRRVRHKLKKAKSLIEGPQKDEEQDQICAEKLEFYTSELEKQPGFHGFQDWVQTYDLHRGYRTSGVADEKTKIGVFKGSVKICKYPVPFELSSGLFKRIPSNDPVRLLVRVYVIRGHDLTPTDYGTSSDPYLKLILGSSTIDDEENYVPNQLNPIFGRCYELAAVFPLESQLCVQVYDKDVLSRNDFIGETRIDLENRFYSSHRGTCGLSGTYESEGYNAWRDSLKPSEILERLCAQFQLDEPRYAPGSVHIGRKVFQLPEDKFQIFQGAQTREESALHVLHHWEELPKVGSKLLPEHIEHRTLYNPQKPGIHGTLEMWIDMFTMDSTDPAQAVDVSPRKPNQYELRVIIWNTDDVILQEQNHLTKEWMSDIFVRGWLKDKNVDCQNTDVHYRSTTGEGNFNWRFIFNFDYIEAEQKIVFKKKRSIVALEETELRHPPILQLEVWDIDIVSANDFLGSVSLNLNKLPRGAQSPKKCKLKLIDPAYGRGNIDLFKQRRIKAWWPVSAKTASGETELTGKVEAELHLLTQEEADGNPAGRGPSGPDELPRPKVAILKYMCIILLICFIFEFIFAIPGYLVKWGFSKVTSTSSDDDD